MNIQNEPPSELLSMTAEERRDFIAFLHFCRERLEAGETLSDIWAEWERRKAVEV